MDATETQKARKGRPWAVGNDVLYGTLDETITSNGSPNSMKGSCRLTVKDCSTGAPTPVQKFALTPEQVKKASQLMRQMLHTFQPGPLECSTSKAPNNDRMSHSKDSSATPSSRDINTREPGRVTTVSKSCYQAASNNSQAGRANNLQTSASEGACAPKHVLAACQAFIGMTFGDLAPAGAIPAIKQCLSNALRDPNIAALAARQPQLSCCCALDTNSGKLLLINAVDKDLTDSLKYIRCQLLADSGLAVESYCALIRSAMGAAVTELLQEQASPPDPHRLFHAAAQIGRSAMLPVTLACSAPDNESLACCAIRTQLTFWLAGVNTPDTDIDSVISNLPSDVASSPQVAALLKAVESKKRSSGATAVDRKVDISATSSVDRSAVKGSMQGWGLGAVLSGFKGMFQRNSLDHHYSSNSEVASAEAPEPAGATDSGLTGATGSHDPSALHSTVCHSGNSCSAAGSSGNSGSSSHHSGGKGDQASSFNAVPTDKPLYQANAACCALLTAARDSNVTRDVVQQLKRYLSSALHDQAAMAEAMARLPAQGLECVVSSSSDTKLFVSAVIQNLTKKSSDNRKHLPPGLQPGYESSCGLIRKAIELALTEVLQKQAPPPSATNCMPYVVLLQAAVYVGRAAVTLFISLPAMNDEQSKRPIDCNLLNYLAYGALKVLKPGWLHAGNITDATSKTSAHDGDGSLMDAAVVRPHEVSRADEGCQCAAKVSNIEGTMPAAAFNLPETEGCSGLKAEVAVSKTLSLELNSGKQAKQSQNTSKQKNALMDKFCSPSTLSLPDTLEATPEELAAICAHRLHLPEAATLFRMGVGWSALHYAVASHKVLLVQQLLDAGADYEAPEQLLQLTPLHLACMGKVKDGHQLDKMIQAGVSSLYDFQAYCKQHGPGNHEIVNLLLTKKAKPSNPVASGPLAFLTPLHILSCWSLANVPSIGKSGRSGSSSNSTGSHHKTCNLKLQFYCLQQLFLAGADLDPAENPGGTGTALRLLDAGADVVPDSPANPASVVAAGDPKRKQQPLGIKHSPDLRPEMLLLNVVQLPASPGRVKLLQKLLSCGGDIYLEEQWPVLGETAINMAVRLGCVECVSLLVAAGADVTAAACSTVQPPLAQAVIAGRADIVRILLDAGAEHSTYFDHHTGYDMLQTAAIHGQMEIVVMLVEAGANWTRSNSREGGVAFSVPQILKQRTSITKLSVIERRLKLAEKTYKQRQAAAAAAAAAGGQLTDVISVYMAATSAERTGLNVEGTTAAAAAVDSRPSAAASGMAHDVPLEDVDALVAAIESVGSNIGTKQSKKDKQKRKGKRCNKKAPLKGPNDNERKEEKTSRQQQQQQQQGPGDAEASVDTQVSATAAATICPLAAVAAAQLATAGTGEHDTADEAELGQQSRQSSQQQKAKPQHSKETQQARSEQPLSQLAAAAATGTREAATSRNVSEHAAGATAAAGGAQEARSVRLLMPEDPAAFLRPAPTATLPSPVMQVPAAAAAAVMPVGLEQWRGTLNPIFLYRSGAVKHRGSPNAAAELPINQSATTAVQQPQSAVADPWQQQQQQQQQQLGVPTSACDDVDSQFSAALMAPGAASTQVAAADPVQTAAAAAAESTDASVDAPLAVTERECIVCYERLSDVLLLPCKHIVLCAVCAEQLQARGSLKECPWCRETCELWVIVPVQGAGRCSA